MPTIVNPSTFKSTFGPLPHQAYTCQVLKVDQSPNLKNSCPQDLFDMEILSPDTVTNEFGEVAAAGKKFRLYITYSAANLANARDMVEKLGFDISHPWSIPSQEEVRALAYTTIPEIQLQTRGAVGKKCDIILSTSPQIQRHAPGPGETKYNARPVLVDGKEQIIGYNINFPRVEDILTKLE